MMNQYIIFVIFYLSAIISYNSCRPRSYLHRCAVLLPQKAPWMRVYRYADEISFLELLGMSRSAFNTLKRVVFLHDIPKRTGRKGLLNNHGKLGLLLFYLSSTMRLKELCLIFGITPSTASSIILEMLPKVTNILRKLPSSRIKFPSHNKMQYYANLVFQRNPTVNNIIGFVDGLSLKVQCSDFDEDQRRYYNGYYHDTCCNNVFAFAPDGKIIYACINFPGSLHDSQVAARLSALVIEKIGNFALCVDQGFPRSGELYGKFVGPIDEKTRENLSPILKSRLLREHNKCVSLRQSSEWGMRALQGSFSRLKSRLTSNTRKRSQIIECIALLHNFRTSHEGLNQIATVFNPEYEKYISVDGYDRIRRYFASEEIF